RGGGGVRGGIAEPRAGRRSAAPRGDGSLRRRALAAPTKDAAQVPLLGAAGFIADAVRGLPATGPCLPRPAWLRLRAGAIAGNRRPLARRVAAAARFWTLA